MEDKNHVIKEEKEEVSVEDRKKEKFVALYQARKILSMHGSMEERRVCSKKLKMMQKQGIKSV